MLMFIQSALSKTKKTQINRKGSITGLWLLLSQVQAPQCVYVCIRACLASSTSYITHFLSRRSRVTENTMRHILYIYIHTHVFYGFQVMALIFWSTLAPFPGKKKNSKQDAVSLMLHSLDLFHMISSLTLFPPCIVLIIMDKQLHLCCFIWPEITPPPGFHL